MIHSIELKNFTVHVTVTFQRIIFWICKSGPNCGSPLISTFRKPTLLEKFRENTPQVFRQSCRW